MPIRTILRQAKVSSAGVAIELLDLGLSLHIHCGGDLAGTEAR